MAPNDLVAALEGETGRDLAAERVPVDAVRAEYEAAQDPLAATFAGLALAAALGTEDLTPGIQKYVADPFSARVFLAQQSMAA